MKRQNTSYSAFSIIEVLIGIFIFSLGLASIYALLESSLNISAYNKNSIIASNLAREQVELFRNIRDTNYKKLQVWKQRNPGINYNSLNLFLTGSYYTLENNFSVSAHFSTEVSEISGFQEGPSHLADMDIYRLCLDPQKHYTYDCTAPNTPTVYYRYLFLEQTSGESGEVYTLSSKVIWYHRGYHEYNIQTIVTDWRRI